MKKFKLLTLSFLLAAVMVGPFASAEETTGEKIGTAGNKAVDSVKKTYRKGKDKTCEMIDGKMSCAGKKIKHKIQNATESMDTKTNEIKDKIDK